MGAPSWSRSGMPRPLRKIARDVVSSGRPVALEPMSAPDRKIIHDTAAELRSDVSGIHDPRARALFETAAEVLGGLEKAFHDYDKKAELAWT